MTTYKNQEQHNTETILAQVREIGDSARLYWTLLTKGQYRTIKKTLSHNRSDFPVFARTLGLYIRQNPTRDLATRMKEEFSELFKSMQAAKYKSTRRESMIC